MCGFIYPADDFLPLSLFGVVVAKNADSSVAVLKNEVTGKTVILTVGNSILEMELTQVLHDGVVLKKGEKIYWLLLEKSPQIKAGDVKAKDSRIDKTAIPEIIQSQREFVRSEVLKRIEQERELIIKETRIVPNYVVGKIEGFKVIDLPKNGIASEVGIQKDDVIKEINGIKLNNLAALVKLYSKISEEERYEVLIDRNNELLRQVYILK